MNRPVAIGIDIGGTRLRAALVDADGRLLARAEAPTPAREGPGAVVARAAELVAGISRDHDGPSPVGAGVSAPGPLDTESGVALGVPTLSGWEGVPIAQMFGEALGLPVRLENDAIAAAHGEWRFGAGRGLAHLIYVTVSTGIGGGVVLDGRLLHGRLGMAGHVGHMSVVRDGIACACGNRGCWEAYASGTAFAARSRDRLAAAGGAGFAAEPVAVFAAARDGNGLARELVAEEADWLGVGIASLLHLYSPEAVILGGGVSNGFGLLEPGIRQRIALNAMPPFRAVPVLPASLGENAGLVGAAALLF